MHNKFLSKIACAGLGLCAISGTAIAGSETGAWHVGAQGLWAIPDHDRFLAKDGGVQLNFGVTASPAWDFDFNLFNTNHDGRNGNPDGTLRGLGFDAKRVFQRNSPINPFLSFGAGYLEDDTIASFDDGLFATVGGGLLADVVNFGNGTKLQLVTDARVRHFPKPGVSTPKVTEYLVGLGFQFVWGGTPAAVPVAMAAPVAAPPPPPAPPADGDKDGVPDTIDACPNTAPNTPVDAKGCDLDTDKDGVFNDVDRCPRTPLGDRVDSQGCSLRARLKVFFDNNSAVLKDESFIELNELASFLNDAPTATGIFEGHTDSVGSDAANNTLSQKRADSVKAYLVSKGVAASRVQAKGFGESQPEADNTTADGRAQNRRVIFQRTDVK